MTYLMKLCVDNAASSTVKQSIFVSNSTGQTLYIRGVIAANFDANAADVIASLDQADPEQVLNIRFNTPGGDVFQGKEIAAAIRNYPGATIGHIDSLCASAGTSIALACDEVEMSKGAFFMIHNAQAMAFGDKTDLRDQADLVEKIELSIVDDYTEKTGKPAEEVIAMMEEETWMDADEALSHGFIDRIAGATAKASNAWNLAAYSNAPAALAPQAPTVAPPPAERSMSQANANRLALIQAL